MQISVSDSSFRQKTAGSSDSKGRHAHDSFPSRKQEVMGQFRSVGFFAYFNYCVGDANIP